jgi:PAS domain-containing protein
MTAVELDALPDAVLVIDGDHTLLALNAAALAVLGEDAASVVGQRVGEAFDVRGAGGAPALRDTWPSSEE